MRELAWLAAFSLVSFHVSGPLLAADQQAAVDPERVQEAIALGLHYLRTQQKEDGKWEFIREVRDESKKTVEHRHDEAYDLGLTALATVAMLENGVPPSDPSIRRAYQYVRRNAERETRTYNIALAILLLEQLGNARDRVLIQRLAYRLVAGQLDSGGWTYTCPVNERLETDPEALAKAKRREGVGDNSNTQFAVLGLWTARRVRANVDEALELVEKRFRNSQSSKGGWDYKSTGESDTPAMTAAGAFILAVAAAHKQAQETQGGSEPGETRQALLEDAAFKRALERVTQYVKGMGKRPAPYFLWSVERLGVVLSTQTFGDVDWYQRGTEVLLANQESDGAWRIAHPGVADTSLALLFLSRGNLVRDLTYALQGDPNKPFMRVDRDGKTESFKQWSEVARHIQDGDVIEIHGNGPFELVGEVLSKRNITIRAGRGYAPVIIRKDDPLAHPDFSDTGHAIFLVRGGPVAIEGLEFRIDPDVPARRPYAAVDVQSGELFISHCQFANTKRQTTAAVILTNGASARIQDSFFLGFTAPVLINDPQNLSLVLDNCLLFTNNALWLTSKKQDASCRVELGNCTVHAGEQVLNVDGYAGRLAVEVNGCVFRAPWICQNLGPIDHRRYQWTGDRNVYDVLRWVGDRGRPLSSIQHLRDWQQAWGNETDVHSVVATAQFAAPRLPGAFKYDLRPTDWLLAQQPHLPDTPLEFLVGCDVYRIGPGPAYERFRLSSRYAGWRAALARGESGKPADGTQEK